MRPDIPQEPYTLMSWVNTKLRDQYESLDELCASEDIERQWIEDTLKEISVEFSEENNRFW